MIFIHVSYPELQEKVEGLIELYNKIKADSEERDDVLEHAHGVSERFWDDLNSVTSALKDMQDTLEDLDQPAVDPAAIRSQKETMESLQEDLDNIQEDIQLVHDEGQELVKLVGDPEIPEVEKNIDELEANFTTLNSKWVERQKSLDDALQHATTFQNELMVSRGQEIIGYVILVVITGTSVLVPYL